MIVEKQYYLDTNVDLYIGEIVEYDMRDAGFNVIKQFSLLPDEVIERLIKLEKKKRHTIIGKMNRDSRYKGISKNQNEKIKDCRVRFYLDNELTDDDILSIKKDAIFVKKYCYKTDFSDSIGERRFDSQILFVPKNEYTAYLHLNRTEFYYNNTTLDVKGIDDTILVYHRDHMLKFIHEMLRLLSNYDYDLFKRKLMKFINDYKKRELPVEYYREFNPTSQYKVVIGDFLVDANDVGDVSMCDISYNYMHIIVPLIGLII